MGSSFCYRRSRVAEYEHYIYSISSVYSFVTRDGFDVLKQSIPRILTIFS